MNLDVNQWALVVSVASFLLAVLVVPAARQPVKVIYGKLAYLIGTDKRRYRSWFEQHHGKLKNIYLDRTETLSLRDTYVPLAGYKANETERVSAADVLHDPDSTRIIVLGDPGSGKSTLLRAFGTSQVSRYRSKFGNPFEGSLPHTPVLVSLRAFARYLESDRNSRRSLRSYIEYEIFQHSARVRQGYRLLAGLMDDDELLLLLDGLDEVPDAMVREVRSEVLTFIESHELRVVLTCRRQNFLAVRTDWVPVFTDRTYTLAPLRDDEVVAFIHRRQKEFTPPRTPSDLFQSINQSGTLELHRVPMILTVSIALYLHLTGYRIPTSLSRFYEEMIKQLLTRHDFRLEHSGSVNTFSADDKLRFLREFSYEISTQSGRLEDFPLEKLVSAAEKMTDRLTTVHRDEGERFVDEIINRSGLVAQASLETEYAFAHRSVQEYLIASKLLGDPHAGADLLLKMADDPEWRLVAIFFASFEHNYVEYFLRELRTRNLELCGHCMATATIADRVLAADTIAALTARVTHDPPLPDRDSAFAALTTLANSHQPWLREQAVNALLTCLETDSTDDDASTFLNLDQEALAQVLHGLASAPSVRVVDTVAHLSSLPAANSIRNIQPLWTFYWARLSVPTPPRIQAVIARRLLLLAESPEGLRELQSQPEPAITPELRAAAAEAYPFNYGLDQDSNLPLMLVALRSQPPSAEALNVIADATQRSDPNLATLERDHSRRTMRLHLFWPARITTITAYTASVFLIISAIFGDSWRSLFFNSWTLSPVDAIYLLPTVCASIVALGMSNASVNRFFSAATSDTGRKRGLLRFPWSLASQSSAAREPKSGILVNNIWPEHNGFARTGNPAIHWVDDMRDILNANGRLMINDLDSMAGILIANLMTLPLAVGVHALIDDSRILFVVVATAIIYFTFWLPATYLCCRGVAVDLRQTNPLLGAYTDPACAHWLRPMY